MSSVSNTSSTTGGRMSVHNKRSLEGMPPLNRSLSRSNVLHNANNGHSPTRGAFYGKSSPDPPQKQLTIETAVFPDHPSGLFHPPHNTESNTSKKSINNTTSANASIAMPPSSSLPVGADTRSLLSGSESTRSVSNNKRKKKNMASSLVNPTDIFAQNLSDAVMDADDSDDLESYVYRDKPNPSYTVPPWTYNTDMSLDHSSYYDRHYSSTGTESNTDGCGGDNYNVREKFMSSRRPVLRSTVSEIRPSSSSSYNSKGKKFKPSFKHKTSSYYYAANQSDDDEFAPLVRSRPPRRRKGSSTSGKNSACCRTCLTLLCVFFGCVISSCFVSLLIAIYASPLTEVEVVGISNVLGTQKELIFNLQVRAKNSNWWTIRMTNTAFSVFASSHYVPTTLLSVDGTHHNDTLTASNLSTLGADPAEFLGTIYHLEDPLIYQSGGLFRPVTSTATSQIQIKNPGSTKDDNRGNERWSLLIRYPYELTVRGVLKYQIMPYLPTLTQLHSVRVCKMSRVDPATGKISDDVTIPKKSICDDPSPVEGSVINKTP